MNYQTPYWEPPIVQYYARPLFYVSMCDCFNHSFMTCFKGFCCPVCSNTELTYQLATTEEPDCCSSLILPCVWTPFYNKKRIDSMYGVRHSDFDDCMVSICCYCCVIVQNQNNYKQMVNPYCQKQK